MRSNNLFFHCGEGFLENQQIFLSNEGTVTVIDGENEFVVQNVRKIDIKSIEQGKVKISLGPQVTFVSSNRRIVINDVKDKVFIEMLNTEEQLTKYMDIVDAQKARGLIDYIVEYAPGMYSLESLQAQSLKELVILKESMDDLANCY
jgi:tryptophan synthase beta subunit